MIGVLRAEWIKLTTLRSHYVLLLIAVAFPVVVVWMVGAFNDDLWTSHDLGQLIAMTAVFSSLLLAVLSAVSLTGEFSHNTMRPTFAAVPGRLRVFATKAVLNAVVVTVLMAAVVIACWAIGTSLLDGTFDLGHRFVDESIGELTSTTVTARLVRAVLYGTIVSVLAVGFGLLVRSTPLTVVLLLVWPLVGESILILIFTVIDSEGAIRWLPMTAGLRMAGFFTEEEVDDLMAPGDAALYFAVFSAAVFALGTLVASRRDA